MYTYKRIYTVHLCVYVYYVYIYSLMLQIDLF